MTIPIYIKQRGLPLPQATGTPARYILADNGLFLERTTPSFTTCVRIDRFELDLAQQRESCRLDCGKIPTVLHRAMLGFFRFAHAAHGGEAALILLFHPRRKVFRWLCPEQTVELYRSWHGWQAADVIHYKNPLSLPDGYVQFGDAHLHVGAPNPSAVDKQDDQDGLHIIVGHIQENPSYHVDFVMDGVRFSVAPEAIFAVLSPQPLDRPPPSWLKQIRLRKVEPLYE